MPGRYKGMYDVAEKVMAILERHGAWERRTVFFLTHSLESVTSAVIPIVQDLFLRSSFSIFLLILWRFLALDSIFMGISLKGKLVEAPSWEFLVFAR